VADDDRVVLVEAGQSLTIAATKPALTPASREV
jgi:hypothetical protein